MIKNALLGSHVPVMTMHWLSLLSRTQRYAEAATAYLQRSTNVNRQARSEGGRPRGIELTHAAVACRVAV